MDPNQIDFDTQMIEGTPVHPCICGHSHLVHGTYTDVESRYEWDDDHKEQIEVQSPYPRPVCYECGPADCVFIEMNNLEYLELKANGNDQR